MPTFTPPVGKGQAWGDPSSSAPQDRLMRYYGSVPTGETVWKDGIGWHQGQYPYLGGARYRAFNDGELISDVGDTSGLLNYQQYFQGGHTYPITQTLADELIAAGFGAYINTEPLDMTWFKPGDEAKFTRWALTIIDPSATYSLSVDGAENLVARENGPEEFLSNNRNFWIHQDTAYNENFDATITIDPTNYGEVHGGDTIIEQAGITLRAQQVGGINRGITINNNIFFVAAFCNIGVWKSNVDGTGFVSRGAAIEAIGFQDFPHRYDVKLEGVIIRVRAYNPITMAPPSWDDPLYAKTMDLDTVGDVGAAPTPIGEGSAGLIAAHLGFSPLVNARYRGFRVGPLGSLFQ